MAPKIRRHLVAVEIPGTNATAGTSSVNPRRPRKHTSMKDGKSGHLVEKMKPKLLKLGKQLRDRCRPTLLIQMSAPLPNFRSASPLCQHKAHGNRCVQCDLRSATAGRTNKVHRYSSFRSTLGVGSLHERSRIQWHQQLAEHQSLDHRREAEHTLRQRRVPLPPLSRELCPDGGA